MTDTQQQAIIQRLYEEIDYVQGRFDLANLNLERIQESIVSVREKKCVDCFDVDRKIARLRKLVNQEEELRQQVEPWKRVLNTLRHVAHCHVAH